MLAFHSTNCYIVFSISNTILFLKVPILVTSISTMSWLFNQHLGFWNAPTPAGVPVITAVPAGIVVPIKLVNRDQNKSFVPYLDS